MKYFFKGITLGFSMVLLNRLCCALFSDYGDFVLISMSGLLFFITITSFLISKSIPSLLLCGFTGLAGMLVIEIIIPFISHDPSLSVNWFLVYSAGFCASIAAIVFSLFISSSHVNYNLTFRRCFPMTENLSNKLKFKLTAYFIISALSFSYLVMPVNAGISVPLFVLLQLACLWFIVPERKKLILCIPIVIISAGSFISANRSWAISNLFVCILIFSAMFTRFDYKNDSALYIRDILSGLFKPFLCIKLPFKWALELNSEKAPTVKRVITALAIALPCVILLVIVLSSADMVFSRNTRNLLFNLFYHINFHTIYSIICGIAVGLYLFGILFTHFAKSTVENRQENTQRKGDLIIINILLSSLLFVYTLFVVVQFKYLFAGSALPHGLSYTEYARKGFFELLALTVVNIALILSVTLMTKNNTGKWAKLTIIFCHYLCAVTIILLISSFYRMWLYTAADGLTRMRFFVMGFLIFELIGLIATFVYIAKPNINITLIYICLALVYYTILSILPTDNIIAKNQIDRYLCGERKDVSYIFTLSADAAPAMQQLYTSTHDEQLKEQIKIFLESRTVSFIPDRWQRFNLSDEKAENILSKLK